LQDLDEGYVLEGRIQGFSPHHNCLIVTLVPDVILVWMQLSFLLYESYLWGVGVGLDTSILIYGCGYHFHLVGQMCGTGGIFDTCILFIMFVEIMQPGWSGSKILCANWRYIQLLPEKTSGSIQVFKSIAILNEKVSWWKSRHWFCVLKIL